LAFGALVDAVGASDAIAVVDAANVVVDVALPPLALVVAARGIE
jgi:hypothetical protein